MMQSRIDIVQKKFKSELIEFAQLLLQKEVVEKIDLENILGERNSEILLDDKD